MTELRDVVVTGVGDGPELAIVDGHGSARAVIWPGMGAHMRSMNRISLGGGSRTIELTHPSDAVYYVIAGSGTVADRGSGETSTLVEGSMVHVDAGTPYQIVAGDESMELVGGPCPPDESLYQQPGA